MVVMACFLVVHCCHFLELLAKIKCDCALFTEYGSFIGTIRLFTRELVGWVFLIWTEKPNKVVMSRL